MVDRLTAQPQRGSAARRRAARLATIAFAASVLLIPGLAAAEEGGGGGGGGEGGPTSLVFELTWETNDGVVHTSMPAPELAGFGAVSFNAGGQEMGTATCTQAAGSAVLTCSYDNKGHGSLPGLVLPNSPKATFTVTVTGVPTGWTVDPTTVGTFTGGEVCPREDGGHEGGEGGHETTTTTTLEGSAPAAGDEGQEGDQGGAEPRFCTHTVALIQDPAPPVIPPSGGAVEALTLAAPVAAPVAVSPAVTG